MTETDRSDSFSSYRVFSRFCTIFTQFRRETVYNLLKSAIERRLSPIPVTAATVRDTVNACGGRELVESCLVMSSRALNQIGREIQY